MVRKAEEREAFGKEMIKIVILRVCGAQRPLIRLGRA
jgi:hypothetical protein